jgi:ABC-type phosphate transport system substrate-binding protein
VKKGRTIWVFLVVILSVRLAQAKQFAVVVDKDNKTDNMKAADLANILNGKTVTWADGKPIRIVMRDPSSQDVEFVFRRVLNMTSEQAHAFIQAHPKLIVVAATDEEISRLVSVVRGSIGILDLYSLTKDVKVVRIDGKLPFDVDYLLKGSD